MLKPWKITASHEDLFIQRYDQILSWSLKLTGHSRQLAEDLVHDAFIQFVLVRPDLAAINNLEGYLYRMLRNMYLSHIRRASRSPAGPVSPVDYDCAEIILRASDIHSCISARQELEIICHYACIRKETSRAGSVLILRFFHGYFPGEIALILQTSRQAVAELLRVARQEARLCLDHPRRLSFMREGGNGMFSGPSFNLSQSDYLNDLRSAIFRTRHNACIPVAQLQKFYRADNAEPINAPTLGHIVSCRRCLDEANALLGLPRLNDRYPTDTLGPDSRSGNGEGAKTDRPSLPSIHNYRRRVTEVIEHCPKELRISVNGFILGSQKISSDLNEFSLSIKDTEAIDFVEVFSEQGVRLFFCNIDAPPDGRFEQQSSVGLSDGRNLDVSLSFCGPWPNLSVIYHDPQLRPAEQAQGCLLDQSDLLPPPWLIESQPEEETKRSLSESFARFRDVMMAGLSLIISWMRPATVTLMLAVLLISAVVLFKTRVTTVSAAELLRRATVSEDAAAASPETVSHRTISFEERRTGDLTPLARRRIEIWQDAAKGVKARRVFDEKDRLVAGEWTDADGAQTIYARGSRPESSTSLQSQATIIEEIDRAWRFDLSARLFAALVGNIEAATVREHAGRYVIEYRGETSSGIRLVSASLTMDKSSLRTIEQSFIVSGAAGEREYCFRESRFERLPASRVAPAVFTPDSVLIETSGKAVPPLEKEESSVAASTPAPASGPAPVATAELEIEAHYQLHRLGACLREQAAITRTPGGTLSIQTVVASERRKAEILEALGPLAGNPAVKLQVETIGEALRNQSKMPPSPAVARRVRITGDRIPLYAELRQYFYERSAGDKSDNGSSALDGGFDQDIRRLANRLLNNSRQALLHAWALRRLAQQSSQDELQSLDADARAKWRAMIREHAARFAEETASLRSELRPIFFAAMDAGAGAQPGEGQGLRQQIETLFDFGSIHEEAVRFGFTISDGRAGVSIIRTEEFWRSLLGAERLARKIQSEN